MNKHLGGPLEWWVHRVTSHAWWVVVATVAVTVAALYYTATHLGVNTDTAELLAEDLPFRKAYQRYKRLFPEQADTLLILIEGDTPEATRKAAFALSQRLKRDADHIRDAYIPTSSEFFDRNGLLYMDVDELENLVTNLATVQPYLATVTQDPTLRGLLGMLTEGLEAVADGIDVALEPALIRLNTAIKAVLAAEPYQVSWQTMMLGEEQVDTRQIIIAQPDLDFGKILPAGPAIREVRDIARELTINGPGVELRLTGSVALSYEELRQVMSGMRNVGLLATALVILVLWRALRSVHSMVATVATLFVGLSWTAGFAALAVGEVNLISIAFAVLYIGLGVDYAIHLCLRYGELDNQRDPSVALGDAAGDVGRALFLSALTTAVGFYAFLPTAYAGVSELGLISGTGMLISFLATLTVLPALLTLWHGKSRDQIKTGPGLLGLIILIPERHGKAILWSTMVLGLIGLATLPDVRFDYNPLNLRDPESESVKAFRDLVDESPTPPWSISLLADSLEAAQAYENRLSGLNTVDRVVSISNFVPKKQEDKLFLVEDLQLILGPQLEAEDTLPPPTLEQQLVALSSFTEALDTYIALDAALPWQNLTADLRNNLQKLLDALARTNEAERRGIIETLEDSLVATLPEAIARLQTLLQASPVSLENLPKELTDRWVSRNGVYRVEVFPKEDLSNDVELRRFVAEVTAKAPAATGPPVINLGAGEAVVGAFITAFSIALVAITLLLFIMLRNFKDTLLMLVPLLLSSVLTGAATVLFDIPFNFANIIALPLLLGIGVDYGIHVIHRVRSGASVEQLLRMSTARAIYYSGLTTIVSFGSLVISSHPGTSSMGQILIIGILLTLASTLLVLPALLKAMDDQGVRPGGLG